MKINLERATNLNNLGEVKMSNNNMREIGYAFVNHAGEFQFTYDCLSDGTYPKGCFLVYATEECFKKACDSARELHDASNACKFPAEQAELEPVKLEHITDGQPCWCNPELNYKDPETGAEVWVHKEPVAWNDLTDDEIAICFIAGEEVYSVRTKDLTDDEIGSIYEKHHALGGCWTDGFAYERAVIAADREKNK